MRLVKLEGRKATFEHDGATADFSIRPADDEDARAYEVARVLCGAKKRFTGRAILSAEDERIGKELLKCA
jgi:hypothetical protein